MTAWKARYQAGFKGQYDKRLYKVEVEEFTTDTPDTVIRLLDGQSPCNITATDSNRGEYNPIVGEELKVDWVFLRDADQTNLNALFLSKYGEWKQKLYRQSFVTEQYDDFYLPSLDELQAIYDILHLSGIGGYSGYYWSSTQNALETTEAFTTLFNTGVTSSEYKLDALIKALPVRHFVSSLVYALRDFGQAGRIYAIVDNLDTTYTYYEALAGEYATGIKWGLDTNDISGAEGEAIGTGSTNTAAIVLVETNSAGNYCNDYSFSVEGTLAPFPESGIVGRWKFNEMKGNCDDSSGFNNTGIISGGVTRVAGVQGGAIKLNGTDGFVSFTSKIFNSVSLWANFNNITSLAYIVGQSLVSVRGIRYTGAAFVVYGNVGIGSSVAWTKEDSLVHFCAIQDGDDWDIYIDSVKIGTSTAAGDLTVSLIGRRYTTDPLYFNGTIDDVIIYNRALSYSEMLSIYNHAPTYDLIWEGFVLPDNLSRNLANPKTYLTISAIKGLKNLELTPFDYTTFGTGFKGFMNTVKQALAPLGLEYNFVVQNTLRESTDSATSCPLLTKTINAGQIAKFLHFAYQSEGFSCYEVLQYLMTQIYSQLRIAFHPTEGMVFLIQGMSYTDMNNTEYIIDYTALTQDSYSTRDKRIDMGDAILLGDPELSLIGPSNTDIKITSRIYPPCVPRSLPNYDDFWTGSTNLISSFGNTAININPNNNVTNPSYITSSVFYIKKATDGYFNIKVSLNVISQSNVTAGTLDIQLKKGAGSYVNVGTGAITLPTGLTTVQTSSSDSNVALDDDYYQFRVQISLTVSDPLAYGLTAELGFLPFQCEYSINSEYEPQITYQERLQLRTNDARAANINSIDTIFFDSTHYYDYSGIFNSNGFAINSWLGLGPAGSPQTLETLISRAIMYRIQGTRQYLAQVMFLDDDFDLHSDNFIILSVMGTTRYFQFVNYERNVLKNTVNARLIEVINDTSAFTVTREITQLATPSI